MRYWISFDLGLKGSYEDLFEWLDKMDAAECGPFVATFSTPKTREQVSNELKFITNDSNARAYIIDMKKGGGFLFGKRKRPPWSGFSKGTETVSEEK